MSVTDTYTERKNHVFPGASQARGDSHEGLSNVRSSSCISPCSRTRLGHVGPLHTVSVPLLVAWSLMTAQSMSRLWAPRLNRLNYRQTRKLFCKEPVASGLSYKILTLCEDASISWGLSSSLPLRDPNPPLHHKKAWALPALFTSKNLLFTLLSASKVELPEALSLEPCLVPLPRTALVDTRAVGLQHLPIVCLPYQEVRSMRAGSRPWYLGLFSSPVCQHSTNSVW